ncbi:MAG: hypothetical protein B7Z15_04035 [Rhizobiales bacterium 32-66-8]|nr:MAG: hypothetical protein B7Z15_04035 [Rhizobiales bacterium 32-66-8]
MIAAVMAVSTSNLYAADFKPAPWQETTAKQLPKVFGKVKHAYWSQDISLWLAVEKDNTKWDIAARPLCAAMDGFGRPAKAFVIITFLDAADLQRNEMTTLAKYTCPDAKVPSAPDAANADAPRQPFQLSSVMGKSQKEVEAVLGKPIEKCTTGKYGLTCDYIGGLAHIVYINKIADWISIQKPGLTFAADAISAFGLTCDPAATFRRDDLIRWDQTCPPALEAASGRRVAAAARDTGDFGREWRITAKGGIWRIARQIKRYQRLRPLMSLRPPLQNERVPHTLELDRIGPPRQLETGE